MDNMNKQDYTLYIYKKDKRTKSGERLIRTQVIKDLSEDLVAADRSAVYRHFPKSMYRAEYVPSMMTVKSLMTGQDVQIASDTPWCCNPASETYWSM
jgi:hypothetical protein